MKKILVLIDFSESSWKAASVAGHIAQQTQAQLTLFHTLHLPIAETTELALMASQLMEEQKQDAQQKLEAFCERLTQKMAQEESAGPLVTCLVREVLLSDGVEQMVTEEGYDLVVMGTTGSGDSLEEVIIGSNTQSIIGRVKCPVLAIPEGAPLNAIRKIIYAADYDDEDIDAIGQLLGLAQGLGARLEVVHITGQQDKRASTSATDFVRDLKAAFPEEAINFEEYLYNDEEEGLQSYLQAREGDLLAILRREEGFFSYLFRRSLADRLTFHTRLPLLVMHPQPH